MVGRLDTPQHWSSKAEEALAVAGQLNDPSSRSTMVHIADCYMRLAKFAGVRQPLRARGVRERSR